MAGKSRFVRPDTVTLQISNNDTLTVKKRLTADEELRKVRNFSTLVDGRYIVDTLKLKFATILAYLIDWTLKDDEGKKVEIRNLSEDDLRAVVGSLDGDSFNEIYNAIEAHDDQADQDRKQEKNSQDGGSKLQPTSPSLAAAAGDMSGPET